MGVSTLLRECSYCHKALTDAASIEAGVGPICRKQANAALAARIPADPVKAYVTLQGLSSDSNLASMPPNVVERYTGLRAMLAREPAVIAAAIPAVEGILPQIPTDARKDWRVAVEDCAFILSHKSVTDWVRSQLIAVVQHLGYIGVASMLAGNASVGATKVGFENGSLYVQGPRNRGFNIGIRKAVLGSKLEYSPERRWLIPAQAYAELNTLLMRFYPLSDGREAAIEAAKVYAEQNPIVASPPKPVASSDCLIEYNAGSKWMCVYSPYNGDYLAGLRQHIPRADMQWIPTDKCWCILVPHFMTVVDLIRMHYQREPSYKSDAQYQALLAASQAVATNPKDMPRPPMTTKLEYTVPEGLPF